MPPHFTISDNADDCGYAAGRHAADVLRELLAVKEKVTLVVATGVSQFHVLETLTTATQHIDWKRVSAFHLDEYIGLEDSHPASFRKYLKERFVDKLPTPIGSFEYIGKDSVDDAESEVNRLNALLQRVNEEGGVDLLLCGIGENGHLAFNDPPADLQTEDPYVIVDLDEKCRRQQLGEGWFPTLESVPSKAISMSIRQIMKAQCIICTVPDKRKRAPLQRLLTSTEVSAEVPCTAMLPHPNCWVYTDRNAYGIE